MPAIRAKTTIMAQYQALHNIKSEIKPPEIIHPEDLHGFSHINFVVMYFTMSPHRRK
jgi:hypothetical protein